MAAGGTRPKLRADNGAEIAETLRKNGIYFGIDVVGGYLTEINVTSPTDSGNDRLEGTRLGEQVIQGWFSILEEEGREQGIP